MKPSDNDKIKETLSKTGRSFKPKADFDKWCRENPQAIITLKMRAEKRKTHKDMQFWRIIMNSRISKLAAAAIITIAVVLSINFWDRSTSIAYAVDQTIQASHSIRYLHVKDFTEGMEDAKEFRLEFDESGNIKSIRAYMPEWDSPSDGEKITVWHQGIAKVWYKKKNSLITMKDIRFSGDLLKAMQLFDPKLVLQNFCELEKLGLVKIEINEPSNKDESITITSTNSSQVKEMGYDVDRTVIFIDQATKLATTIEHYRLTEKGNYKLSGWTEFFDYDQQIDPTAFTLEDEVPLDVNRVDWSAEEIGLAQGELTDKEIAVKIVREFYEALIAGDYAKAGRLYSNISADRMKEKFADINIVRIISIGEPVPHPEPRIGGFQVPCKIEIEKDGVKSVYEPYGPAVRPVYGQPERWNIHGGVK